MEQTLALNPASIIVGERNSSLFEYMRFQAYEVAFRFKQREDFDGFVAYLLPIAKGFNNRLLKPLLLTEVTDTVRSTVKWCLSSYKAGLSSEEATRINLEYRWKGHKKKQRRKLIEHSCKHCGDDISHKRADAVVCSTKCRMALHRLKMMKCGA